MRSIFKIGVTLVLLLIHCLATPAQAFFGCHFGALATIDLLDYFHGPAYKYVQKVHLPPIGDKIWIHFVGVKHTMARLDVKSKTFDLQVEISGDGSYGLTPDGKAFYLSTASGLRIINLDRWEAKAPVP